MEQREAAEKFDDTERWDVNPHRKMDDVTRLTFRHPLGHHGPCVRHVSHSKVGIHPRRAGKKDLFATAEDPKAEEDM